MTKAKMHMMAGDQNRWLNLPSLVVASMLVSAPMPSWAAAVADEEEDPYEFTPLVTQRVNDFSSSVDFNLRYLTEDAFKFGEYNSQNEQGWQVDGGFDIEQRDFEDGTGKYLRAEGDNVGNKSAEVAIEGGQQGDHKFRISYKGTEKQVWNFLTPYDLSDPNDQSYTAGSTVPAAGEAAMLPFMTELNMAMERRKLALAVKKKVSPQWNFNVDVSSETKEGYKDYGLRASDGPRRPHIVALPIDYTTNVFSLGAEYLADRYQLQLGYELSQFDNASAATTYESPDDVTKLNTMAQEPDNLFQQLSLNGLFRITDSTRATAFVAYNKGEQDESLLPVSANANTLPANATPRSSAETEIENLIVRLGLSSRVTNKLTLNAKASYQDKDNQSTAYTSTGYVGYDRGNGSVKDTSAPFFDTTWKNLALNGYYRLPKGSKFGLGYEFENIERPDQNREETDEHKLWASYKLPMMGRFTGTLKASVADRDGSEYDASTISQFMKNNAGSSDLDGTQNFYDADRKQKKLQFSGQYQLGQTGYVGLMLQRWNDDYHEAAYGLQEVDGGMYTIDFGAQPMRTLSYSLYVGVQEFEYDQRSNKTDDWTLITDDQALLAGVSVDWEAIPNLLKLNLGYRYTETKGELDQSSVNPVTDADISPLPDLETTIHTVEIGAEYFVNKQTTVLARAVYEDYESANWAFDGLGSVAEFTTTTNNYLAGGMESPNHNAAMVELGVRYQF